ncbi:hypothetical protein F4801DRAFT_535646 [Xylaria longipes]|nr:hypothetical protein F4801DRAFT_535646 [Xylaria longipes]
MPGISNHAQKPKPKSQTDTTGLVAIIVVLVLLLLGSATAYLLMRRHFAKRRKQAIAAATAADSVGREEGKQGSRGPGILRMTPEKETQTKLRQRSVAGTTGDEDRSQGDRTKTGMEKDTWI